MKKIAALILFFTSTLALASDGSYLFIQDASDAKLVHNTRDQYTLVMKSTSPQVWYFTDRPQRKSGTLSLNVFDKLWTSTKMPQNFSKVPPNAAIALTDANGKKTGLVAVLGKPVREGNLITYPLTKISHNKIIDGSFNQAILFIDNVQWNPGGF